MRTTFALGLFLTFVSLSAAACTGVVIAKDGHVIAGGNEVWFRNDSYMWAEPTVGTLHGVVYFGYEIRGEFGNDEPYWYEFQGINSAGLFFDSFGAPCAGLSDEEYLKPYMTGRMEQLIMRSCATVEDAVRMITQYNRSFMICMQYLLVDRTGAAAVVENGAVVWMEDDTFAVTNFHLSNRSHGGWPCWRYDAATRRLAEDSDPTIERVASILNATHTSGTRYSVVCDLITNRANAYYLGDFRHPIAIDLETLWAEGSERVALAGKMAGRAARSRRRRRRIQQGVASPHCQPAEA